MRIVGLPRLRPSKFTFTGSNRLSKINICSVLQRKKGEAQVNVAGDAPTAETRGQGEASSLRAHPVPYEPLRGKVGCGRTCREDESARER